MMKTFLPHTRIAVDIGRSLVMVRHHDRAAYEAVVVVANKLGDEAPLGGDP